MNTILTFKATKASENKDVQYQVDLGEDILDKVPDTMAYATAHAKVELQNRKGALLRQSASTEDALATLKTFGYEHATVELYVPTTKPKKELTPEDIRKAIASGKLAKDAVLAVLNK